VNTFQRIVSSGDDAAGPGLTTTIILLALIAGLIFLTWEGRVNGDAFVSLASVIIGGVLVSRGVSSGAQASNSTSPTP
jgi:hypothetical protein